MDTPNITKPSNITKTSFTAHWQTVDTATKYYLDVATDAAFTSFVAGYQNKEVAVNYDAVTGLTDTTHYFYRVIAANADDSDVSAFSYSMEVVTGFFIGGMSIEFGNLVADLFNVQGITIEVSTDFNFQAIIRDKDGNKVNSAKCLLILEGWTDKGAWNPNTDPDPATPTEGDYYTISATGENDITGEIEEFTTVDLLVYYQGVWAIKKRAHVYSDAFGVANMNVFYLVDNLFIVEKSGYQIEKQTLNYVAGEHQYDLILFPVISTVHTSKGHAVSHKPNDRTNKHFN
jgi:hypothetical protein